MGWVRGHFSWLKARVSQVRVLSVRIGFIIALILVGHISLSGCSSYHNDRFHDRYDEAYETRRDHRRTTHQRHLRQKYRQSRNIRGSGRKVVRDVKVMTPRQLEQKVVARLEPDADVTGAADADTSEAQEERVEIAPEVKPESAAEEVETAATRNAPAREAEAAATLEDKPKAQSNAVADAPAPTDDEAAAGQPSKSGRSVAETAAKETSIKQIEDGYRLLRAGFVKKARERFEQAMAENAADASLALGRSMDPTYLKTVAFPDVIPDADQAQRMFRRAVLLGNKEAKADLTRLERALAAAEPTVLSPTTPANAAPVQ